MKAEKAAGTSPALLSPLPLLSTLRPVCGYCAEYEQGMAKVSTFREGQQTARSRMASDIYHKQSLANKRRDMQNLHVKEKAREDVIVVDLPKSSRAPKNLTARLLKGGWRREYGVLCRGASGQDGGCRTQQDGRDRSQEGEGTRHVVGPC